MLSLRAIIGLTIGGLLASISTLRGAHVGWEAEEILRRETGGALAVIAEGMAEKIQDDMQARANQVMVLSSIDALTDRRDAQRVVDEIAARDPTIAWVGVTDAVGKVIAGSGGLLVGQSAAARPAFARALNGLFVGDVHDAMLLASLLPNPTGEPMKFVDVSAPLHGADGRFAGVLAAHYSWSWVRDLVRRMLESVHSRHALEVFVVAADNVVLLGDETAIGKSLTLDSITSAREGGRGWRIETWPDGKTYLTGYASGQGAVTDLGWTLLVRQPTAVAFAPADAVRWRIFASGASLAAVFGILGWAAAGRIARPLQAIADAANRIRRGEPEAIIPQVGGAREIRVLSQTLRDLVHSLTMSNSALAASHEALTRVEDLAYRDRLTALPNRRFFEQYLEAATARAGNDAPPVAVLYIDLDGFKPINDHQGHDAGDEVLRQVGERLATCLRQGDVVARIGGDEFAAVLTSVGAEMERVPARIIRMVNEPIPVRGELLRVGCSIGVAVWPRDGDSLEQVLKRADEALYQAKRQGKNQTVVYGAPAAAANLNA